MVLGRHYPYAPGDGSRRGSTSSSRGACSPRCRRSRRRSVGRAGFAAFSSAKGALRNLAQSAAKELGPKGIHVGHVVIDGGIDGEKLHKGLPDYAAQRAQEGRLIDLGGIAEVYLGLHRQRRAAWTFEADVRTHSEPW